MDKAVFSSMELVVSVSVKKNWVLNRPFLSSPQSRFQSEPKYEIFTMVIHSNFNMNKN